MAFRDFFSSKEEVAQELAEHEVATSPIVERINTMKQADEFVECTKMYLMDKYDKDAMVAYLDEFYR